MFDGEIKPGDKLLFIHGDSETSVVKVISVLMMHGETVIIVSIDGNPPVHIDEDLLRLQCVRSEE